MPAGRHRSRRVPELLQHGQTRTFPLHAQLVTFADRRGVLARTRRRATRPSAQGHGLAAPFDLVVTVRDSAAEECPYFAWARRQEQWGFSDPSAATGSEDERLAAFCQARDAISARIDAFLAADRAS